MSAGKTFLLGILGGAFIGFGSFMAISIGGACPGLVATNPGLQKMVYGAFGLPFGLFLVLLCGAELFTGNTALLTAAVRASPDMHKQQACTLQCSVLLVKHRRCTSLQLPWAITAYHQVPSGDATYVQVAEEKATMGQLAKNWASSYLGNFVGSLLMVWVVACTGLLATAPAPLNIAVAKTSLTFGQVSESLVLNASMSWKSG